MFSSAEMQVLYKAGNAPIANFPFPHLYVNEVFTADFYREILSHLPPPEALDPISNVRPVAESYGKVRSVLILKEDFIGRLAEPYQSFWRQFAGWLLNGNLADVMLQKFAPHLQKRFAGQPDVRFAQEALLVQDSTNYQLGPHTDTPKKVLSLLFYLPKDETQQHLGTSLYIPKMAGFTCAGGPAYAHEKFHRVATMPFLPNSLFAFLKAPNAFHGVEPIVDSGVTRTLLLFDIQAEAPPK